MRTIQGNLLDMYDNGDFDVIVHGCNCYCNMGGGIAAQIADRYADVERADYDTPFGDPDKMGTVMWVDHSSRIARWFPYLFNRKYVINAYTQYQPGRDGNITTIRAAFANIAEQAAAHGATNLRIGIPAIGCGIAGLTWEEVEPVIDEAVGLLDITLVEFVPT